VKLTVAAENPLERLALALGIAPVTLMDTHIAFIRARAVMVATRLGVFDALAGGPLAAAEVAARCGASPHGMQKLLNALAGCGYLREAGGRFALTSMARTWLTSDSPRSVRDKVLFEFVEWSLLERAEEFVRTGAPVDLHGSESEDQWGLYQRAMRSLAGLAAPEIVGRTPMPSGAATMLDIGGSHGYISVAMCRRYPQLRATVLDLPAAVAHAAPILAHERMGDRVVHRAGNALTDQLGSEAWDFVFVSQLVHHFDEQANRDLMKRIARALKPRGVVVVLEEIRGSSAREAGQVGALLDFYFALTSRSGTWSVEEISGWQRDAGLVARKTIRLRTAPGAAEVIAAKSGR
jgi:SAM-dependent methyltransferase